MLIHLIILTTLIVGLPNRGIIKTFVFKPLIAKQKMKVAQDKWITNLVNKTSEVKLQKFLLVGSRELFGGMSGLPGKPLLSLSKTLYKTFTQKELEYVILHELGHYINIHPLKEVVTYIFLVAISFVLTINLDISLVTLTGLFLGILSIQIMKLFEFQADNIAIRNISDINGAISATKKFQSYYGNKRYQGLRSILSRSIPYRQRLQNFKSHLKQTQSHAYIIY